MEAHDAVLGGEGNGGVIDPRVGLVRDSFVGMALVLEAMACSGLSLRELADRLPAYHMIKGRLDLPTARVPEALAALRRHFDTAEASTLDGLRLDWPEQWLLVRPSNTEPLVRLIVEAATPEAAESLYAEAAAVIRGSQG
jgi:phosphomannomutase